MRLFGLIGYPLSHSFSKRYFTGKFEREDIQDCRYELFPISDIGLLPALLKEHPGLEGLNVTIPYKQAVLPFLHDKSGLPEGVAACNTIRIREGRLYGYNTDVIGFEQTLLPLLRPRAQEALVLGSGGATEAVLYVLRRLSIPYRVVSRTLKAGSDLTYDRLTPEMISAVSLIINTTPLGTAPAVHECPPIPYEALSEKHLLYDLVYNPAETEFMRRGRLQGAAVTNGYAMLVGQAEAAWAIWNT